jgi:hypothetical protein
MRNLVLVAWRFVWIHNSSQFQNCHFIIQWAWTLHGVRDDSPTQCIDLPSVCSPLTERSLWHQKQNRTEAGNINRPNVYFVWCPVRNDVESQYTLPYISRDFPQSSETLNILETINKQEVLGRTNPLLSIDTTEVRWCVVSTLRSDPEIWARQFWISGTREIIIIFLLFLVGWDWVHSILRPLLAYCTSPWW